MDRNHPHQIVAIDLLRFACAALVTAFHFLTILPLADASPLQLFAPGATLPSEGAAVTWFGWVGVELFFVISGYVIALSAGASDQATFLRRRVLRLAPVAWICATLTALALLAVQPVGEIVPRWVNSMLFLPVPQQIDAPYWTLRVELAFYLLVTLLLRGGDNHMRIERIGWGLGLWSAGYWVVALATGATSQDAIDTPLLTLILLPHGAFFALGIALWSGRRDGWSAMRMALAMLTGATCCVEIVIHARTMLGVPGINVTPLWPLLVFAAGIATIAGAGALQRPLVDAIGEGRLRMIGRMTYPLYLINLTIGAALTAVLLAFGNPPYVAIALAAALILALAYAIARYAEPRLRAWLAGQIDAFSRRRARRRDSLPSASPPAG